MAEKKSLVKNSIFNMIYKGFTALFPLITTSYISRVLLPAGVGRVGYANTIVAYFVLIASLGIPTYGVKAIAQSGETKEGRSRTFWELFFINLAATLMCIVAYYVFVDNFPHFADRKLLFQIMGLMLVLNIFNIDWFYQGMEEYSYIATRSIIVKILSFVAMLLFVKKAKDYVIYAFILCVATAGNNLLKRVESAEIYRKPGRGSASGQTFKAGADPAGIHDRHGDLHDVRYHHAGILPRGDVRGILFQSGEDRAHDLHGGDRACGGFLSAHQLSLQAERI